MYRRTVLASFTAAAAAPGAAVADAASSIETDDGQRLFYRDSGRGKPVLFIHGWTLSSEIWKDQLAWFADHGRRTIAYDRRGHGHSSKPESGYDYERLAADLATVIDRLDLKDLTLVSHSMAAGEVVRYFARHGSARIARVLLVAPTTPFVLKTADNPEGVDSAVFDKAVAAMQADREAYLETGRLFFWGANPSPENIAWSKAIALQASVPAVTQCMRAYSQTDFRPEMKAVTVPTLIFYGTADNPVVPRNAQRTHAAIAGSRLEVYEGAPHALFLTDPERFRVELLAFTSS